MNVSTQEIGYLMLGFFLVLMFLKMPIGVAMILSGFVGLCLIRGVPAALSGVGIISWRQGLNETLTVIPLFTWMGILAAAGGISRDAFSSLYKLIGRLRGGLAMACTCACAAFGAVCGNHIATAATMSSVALPEMRKYHYTDEFSLGCIASSGNLGIMIPPSGAFVLYGFITETSIGALFISGILPGLLITLLFCIQIYIQCRINPVLGTKGPRTGWVEKMNAIKGLWSILLVFILVMGGIYTGVFTPTEGASCGCFVVIIIGFATRRLSWKSFVNSTRETLLVSSMIMLMIIGAMIFGSFITTSEIPNAIVNLINSVSVNRFIIIGGIIIIYLIAGFIMDIFAILIVTLPIFFPIVISLGFDPLHFGVISILTIMMGSISPPFGIVVFAIGGMNKDVPLFAIFRGCVPYLITMLVGLAILLFFPIISTLLPNFMFPYR